MLERFFLIGFLGFLPLSFAQADVVAERHDIFALTALAAAHRVVGQRQLALTKWLATRGESLFAQAARDLATYRARYAENAELLARLRATIAEL